MHQESIGEQRHKGGYGVGCRVICEVICGVIWLPGTATYHWLAPPPPPEPQVEMVPSDFSAAKRSAAEKMDTKPLSVGEPSPP